MIATFPEARGVAVVKETVIALLGAEGTLSASAMTKLTPETRPPRGPEGNVPIWSVGRRGVNASINDIKRIQSKNNYDEQQKTMTKETSTTTRSSTVRCENSKESSIRHGIAHRDTSQ